MNPRFSRDTQEVPSTISVKTAELRPLLASWRRRNARVPWAYLLRDALAAHLAPVAGKRGAHLVRTGKNEVAA